MAQSGSMDIWTAERLKQLFNQSDDIVLLTHTFGDQDSNSAEVLLLYSEGAINGQLIGELVLPALEMAFDKDRGFRMSGAALSSCLPLLPFHGLTTAETISENLFEGKLLLVFPGLHAAFLMNIGGLPQRSPEESNTELSIKGPRDGFVETLSTNTALIRKRIRSHTLCCEKFVIGKRTRTKVALMYVRDILSPELLVEARSRLESIDVDGIFSISQIEELVTDQKFSLMPLMDYTGRPDFAVSALLNGRFVLLVDGNPMVLIAPSTMAMQIKSPEDLHTNFYYTSFSRLVRILSIFLCVLLPGFWVSLAAFHQDQVPFRLLATITIARLGLPFSGQFELLILLILLEVFREAGIRLPSAIGQVLTVVGGLIIGDAAIRAGLVSPSVVVVGAITAVSNATLVNQNLSSAVSLVRFFLFFLSCILGMFGLIMGLILVTVYLSRLRSFGVPYLSPFSPPIYGNWAPAFMRLPWSLMTRRPKNLHTRDKDHMKEDNP
ncbi:spore germination protein [Paenibacillus sp. UNC499MF]|uniref:spore germination protein n=1 Tax=Paenibacillus sp. UNC499MF TaxID=1502751 RepID=UPI00089FF0D1|nr:spore germination protein [Paenibacillus sp. UNC499MF]SEG43527.1 GerA spore germination protein [Paenibacillus sp. UNC499MF]